jgi:hypothetical protein
MKSDLLKKLKNGKLRKKLHTLIEIPLKRHISPFYKIVKKSGKEEKIYLSQRESALTQDPSLSTQKKASLHPPPYGAKSCLISQSRLPLKGATLGEFGRFARCSTNSIETFEQTWGKIFS